MRVHLCVQMCTCAAQQGQVRRMEFKDFLVPSSPERFLSGRCSALAISLACRLLP